jgi:hypothetical protein
MSSAEQVSLVCSQGCEKMASFLTFYDATVVSEISIPSVFVSLTMVQLTWKLGPTKNAAPMTL